MRDKGIILASALAMALLATLAGAQASQIVPYSNATQLGYHILNVSTDSVATLSLGNYTLKFVQNYITPSTAGATINNVSYNLTMENSVAVGAYAGVYMELTKVNYIPRLHTVDINLYQNVTTTTTIPITTTSTTLSTVVTTIAQTTLQSSTTSVQTTTTIQQSVQSGISGLLQRIWVALQSFFSKL